MTSGGGVGLGGGDQHTWHFNIKDRPKGIHIFFIIFSGKNMMQNEC